MNLYPLHGPIGCKRYQTMPGLPLVVDRSREGDVDDNVSVAIRLKVRAKF